MFILVKFLITSELPVKLTIFSDGNELIIVSKVRWTKLWTARIFFIFLSYH